MLLVGFLLAVTGAFVAIALWSFELLHGGDVDSRSPLTELALVGPEETVFDWSRQGCTSNDFPDAPARAFRGADGQVHLIASHYVTRAEVGSNLDSVEHRCDRVFVSKFDGDPAQFSDRQWLTSLYTTDGRRVYALVHDEYQGHKHAGQCPSGQYERCWFNAITLAQSLDGGRTFSQAPPPRNLVASVPYGYQPDAGPYGLFSASNILYRDGYYYAVIAAQGDYGAQPPGTCVIRTQRLDRADAWRAWNGQGFDASFANPYGGRVDDVARHICAPISFPQIAVMTNSLTFNTYLDKYVLVGPANSLPSGDGSKGGFYYSTSDDLIHWEKRKLIRAVELNGTYECGDLNPVGYPSLLDPESPSRNFETTGQRPWLYFTRLHYKQCAHNPNRDLVRIRVRFTR
jgi:hypothetical protein